MLFAPIKRIRQTISLRIAFLFCFTFTFGLAMAFLVTYFELRHSLERSSREVLYAKFLEAKAILIVDGPEGLNRFLTTDKNEIRNADYMFRVLSEDKTVAYFKPSIQDKEFDFDKAFNTENAVKYLGWHSISAIDDEDNFNMYTEKISTKYYLQIGRSSEEREGILEEILLNFGILEVILVVLSIILGSWYARRSLAPIRDLLSTMHLIEKGNLSQRVTVPASDDELKDLSETFNRMVTRVEKVVTVMRESLDNVSHDIRTPLTRIRAVAADAILSEDKALLKSSLEDCAESAGNISELVDQLLSISEAEAGTLPLYYKIVNVHNLLNDVAEIYEYVAQEKNIQILIDATQPNLEWRLDQKRIKQVIGNLIDNSIKFSPSQTQITLKAFQINNFLSITIEDQGTGVTSEELERIWDRLYRGDKSRSTKGLGLGLSIVRAIVNAHQGSIKAICRIPVGMIFEITLP